MAKMVKPRSRFWHSAFLAHVRRCQNSLRGQTAQRKTKQITKKYTPRFEKIAGHRSIKGQTAKHQPARQLPNEIQRN